MFNTKRVPLDLFPGQTRQTSHMIVLFHIGLFSSVVGAQRTLGAPIPPIFLSFDKYLLRDF